jgi:hypothetical protein
MAVIPQQKQGSKVPFLPVMFAVVSKTLLEFVRMDAQQWIVGQSESQMVES